MVYKINKASCVGCCTCMQMCQNGAIKVDADGKCVIDPKACQSCGACVSACPMTAIVSEQ